MITAPSDGTRDAPARAGGAKVHRWFLRCLDCLAVTAVAEDPTTTIYWQGRRLYAQNTAPKCECGGSNDIMGRVGSKDRFTALSLRCPCDSRCTHATGPNCECSCGGANHGTTRVVCVKVDAGGVPRTQGANLAAAQEFRAAVDAARSRLARLPFAEQFAAGQFIPDRTAWEQLRAAHAGFAAARKYLTHSRRLRALAKVAV
jgi:hypothetical protein